MPQRSKLLRRPLLALSMFLMTTPIGACASRGVSIKDTQSVAASAASLRVKQDPYVRESCFVDAAPLPAWTPPEQPDEAAWQAFGVRQTAALDICNGKRRLAVATGDLHNVYAEAYQKALAPRPWWRGKPKMPAVSTTIDEILARTP
jgi:hypothetical protein